MDVEQAIRGRFSTRAFLPQPVQEAALRALLELARWAPSGGNCQPWTVYVACGDGMARFRREFADEAERNPGGDKPEIAIYPQNLEEPYRSRRFACGEALYAAIGVPREDRARRLAQFARNFDFFGAPAALFFALDRQMGPGQWAHLGMLMQTIALAAEARGLSTCMQEAWASRHTFVRRFFAIPDALQFYCGMAIGYADRAAPINRWRTERAPVDAFATFVCS
jgi:nitroreductase